MVLQNKYKARASRRYNAARGGTSDSRGRSGNRGVRIHDREAFPSLEHEEVEKDSEGSPSLNEGDDDSEEGETLKIESKYARRQIQSNAWRYAEVERDRNEDEEEAKEEPDVDLSGLLERVAKLDSTRMSKAVSSVEAAESSLKEDQNDIDHSLSHLLERQREREGRKYPKRDGVQDAVSSNRLCPSQLRMLEMEGKKLLEEKEREKKHYGKAQGLRSQQPRTFSINIGENTRRDGETIKKNENGITHRQINLAALYGDEEISDSIASGREFDLPLHSEITETPHHVKGRSTRLNHHLTSSSALLKEHEDFLDSII